jgi:hypothetical protein
MLKGGRMISYFLSTKLNFERLRSKGGAQMQGLRINDGGGEKWEEESDDV